MLIKSIVCNDIPPPLRCSPAPHRPQCWFIWKSRWAQGRLPYLSLCSDLPPVTYQLTPLPPRYTEVFQKAVIWVGKYSRLYRTSSALPEPAPSFSTNNFSRLEIFLSIFFPLCTHLTRWDNLISLMCSNHTFYPGWLLFFYYYLLFTMSEKNCFHKILRFPFNHWCGRAVHLIKTFLSKKIKQKNFQCILIKSDVAKASSSFV